MHFELQRLTIHDQPFQVGLRGLQIRSCLFELRFGFFQG